MAVDLGGRGWASIDLPFRGTMIGGLSGEMIPHLLQSFARTVASACTCRLLAGENDHHRAEATFKALARALDDATRPDLPPAGRGAVDQGRHLIDLHVHTTASDGRLTPTEVVQAAVGAGLSAVAITDHDVVCGLGEAASAAAPRSRRSCPASR